MLFNSWGYLVCLLCFYLLYWLLSLFQDYLPIQKVRIILIALGSIAFYAMWRWDFALLVIFSALVDFTAASKISNTEVASKRKIWLLVSLTINLGLLLFFKYAIFAYENLTFISSLLSWQIPEWESLGINIILPIGISFYTFQTISYTIDVYRKTTEPVKSFPLFLSYVMFWPQLIAGPILRAGEVIPELSDQKQFSPEDLGVGTQRIIQGLFKKVVMADSLAFLVDDIFGQKISEFNALDVWTAAFLFGFQIYFDFAGYSDIALGSARLLGIRFPENFNWPYISKSPKEFWGRWHISLGSWIRDYIYLPLTGNRFETKSVGGLQHAAIDPGKADKALILTWFIMGLWHGAAWTFAVWGIYHGLTVLIYRRTHVFKTFPEKKPLLSVLFMLPIAMIGWIPFRATSLADTFSMYTTILNPYAYQFDGHKVTIYAYMIALLLTIGNFLGYLIYKHFSKIPSNFQSLLRICAISIMVAMIMVCMRPIQQFIYFQF